MNLTLKFDIVIIENFHQKTTNEITNLIEKRLSNLNTGDIVIISNFNRIEQKNEHINDSVFYLVKKVKAEIQLVNLKKTTDGTLAVPNEVTRAISVSRPALHIIDNYSKIYNIGLNEYKNCFRSIELDYKAHFEQLPNEIQLNNKLNTHSAIFYFFEFPLDTNNNINYIKLKENFYTTIEGNDLNESMKELELEENLVEIDDNEEGKCEKCDEMIEDLEIAEDERDLEVEDFARQFKNIYENNFINFLKNLQPNTALNATSLPTKKYNKNTYEDDSNESTTLVFYLDNLELDEKGNINIVVATSFDRTEKCYFTPFLCKDYGPYYRTNLLCSYYNIGRSKDKEAINFFLDLTIDLYNLIE